MAKILVVDDDPSVRQALSAFFCDLKGHTVYTAQDADEAIYLVQKHHPQVALLDIIMPDVHGIRLLHQIKIIRPNTKIIMISGMDDESIANEAIEAGAVDYVTKPLDLKHLDTLVSFQLLD